MHDILSFTNVGWIMGFDIIFLEIIILFLNIINKKLLNK